MSVKKTEIAARSRAAERKFLERIIDPLEKFIDAQVLSGLLLMFTTIIALVWANSAWGDTYLSIWENYFTIGYGTFSISKPLLLWINDGLMAIFFFVVGLEIKREVMAGELSSFRKAAFPLFAAIGGMVVPALFYLVINFNKPGMSGWGIPMATDIAFALGVMALLRNAIPLSLKVFLVALAIVDDLGAVIVIATSYTDTIYWPAIGAAAVIMVLLVIANKLNLRNTLFYIIPGIILWYAFLKSGVHATIAGVLLAITIPAHSKLNVSVFIRRGLGILNRMKENNHGLSKAEVEEKQQAAIEALAERCRDVQSPLQLLETSLHAWVSFFIMPVFALANAGVVLGSGLFASYTDPLTLGILAGLLAGKPLGIVLFSWIGVKLKITELPPEISWQHILGVGFLGGIGFTMSIFISGLAFGGTELLPVAKLAILTASLLAGLAGGIILQRASRRNIGI